MSGTLLIVEQVARALGHAVVQSLWQCAFLGALAALVQTGVRRAAVRYAVWCISLAMCAGWFALTFVSGLNLTRGDGSQLGVLGSRQVDTGIRVHEVARLVDGRGFGLFEGIAVLWSLGFVLVTARFIRQCGSAQRLRSRDASEATGVWAEIFADVRSSLGVAGRVRLLVSDVARSPMVVGWVTPTVVVPASVLTMMSPEQVRLVLAHELAHIRRYDHVVNMLQVLVETVMFYHPVIWWVSRQARVEREHCCDDAAVRCGGDAVSYARALTNLEEVRLRSRAVLGLHQGGFLMNRIQRIVNGTHGRRGGASRRVLAMVTAAGLIAGAGFAHASLGEREPRREQIEVVRSNVESGVMTPEQARRVFNEVIFPGSDMERRIRHEMGSVRAEIERAVESGRLSAEDAALKLDSLEAGFAERTESMFRMRVLGMTMSEVRLSLLAEELAGLVVAGELTQGEADEKYAYVEREIGMELRVEEHLARVGRSLREAVQAGELSQEEARLKYQDAKRNVEMRLKWNSINMRIKAAVESGAITPEEAEAKMRAEFAQAKGEVDAKEGDAKSDFDWEGFKERVEGAVRRGDITREEADAEYRDMKRRLELEARGESGEAERVDQPERQGKLTPMDEAYWLHQGIRPLDAYDNTFADGC